VAVIQNKKMDQPIQCANCNGTEHSKVPVTVKSLTVSVFFDGTGNNRFNTESARKDTKLLSKDVSYENYYSNVALLYMGSVETDTHKRVYIQGAGTVKGETDYSIGLGLAHGKTGITARVMEAFKEVEKYRFDSQATELIINVYGFSRGAAYARHFCYRLKAKNKAGNDLSRLWGIELPASSMNIKFMGIFDTVSSFGTNHYDDVHQLDVLNCNIIF